MGGFTAETTLTATDTPPVTVNPNNEYVEVQSNTTEITAGWTVNSIGS